MNTTEKLFLLCIGIASALIFTKPAKAEWTAEEQAYSKSYSLPFKDPFAASVWRVASYPWYMASDFPDYKKLVLKIEEDSASYYMRTGTFIHRDSSGRAEKRPLFVFLPGIFADLTGPAAYMQGYFFFKKGYNVLMFSNPWSKNWIVDNPLQPMGNVEHEVNTIKKIIDLFKARTPTTTTSLYGYSYGAFLAARLAATSNESYESLLLVGPPLNLMASMYRLDDLADESYSQISGAISTTLLGLGFLNRASQDQLAPDTLSHAEGIAVYSGFVEELASSILTYGYRHNIEYEPKDLPSGERRAWIRSWRFKDYVKKFIPNFESFVSRDKGLLIKWIELASKKSINVKVLTAQDDFINDSQMLKPFIDDPRFMILPNGGHVGYLNTEWYWNLLETLYGKGTPKVEFPIVR